MLCANSGPGYEYTLCVTNCGGHHLRLRAGHPSPDVSCDIIIPHRSWILWMALFFIHCTNSTNPHPPPSDYHIVSACHSPVFFFFNSQPSPCLSSSHFTLWQQCYYYTYVVAGWRLDVQQLLLNSPVVSLGLLSSAGRFSEGSFVCFFFFCAMATYCYALACSGMVSLCYHVIYSN